VLCQFDAVPHGVQSASWIRSLQGTEGAAAWGSAPSRQSGSRVRPPLPRGRFDHPRLHLTVSKIGTLSTAFPGGPDAGFSLTRARGLGTVEEARPRILGALLDAVAVALANESTVELRVPQHGGLRGVAAGGALAFGRTQNEFLAAYEQTAVT
jgi:hypothetical protein